VQYEKYQIISVLKTDRTGRSDRLDHEPEGGRSGSVVGSDKHLDRSKPLGTGKTGEPAVFPNRRVDSTPLLFFFAFTEFFFFNRRNKKFKTETV
jgi:hypothetical protein